ncbi:MAG: KH domain-containing protein [Desulfobacteraceae bacterium]|nr:KH domain-containing protein [Desulfobacteraceae bacterium]
MDCGQLVEYIAKALVDDPDNVSVSEISGIQTTVFELKVAKKDVGKVIGKQGRNAEAIRHLLFSAAAKSRKGVALEILE